MIYPLSWLSEYIPLPKDTNELAQKLTMAGHMLDKLVEKDKDVILDLELRGNRPDLLGIYGLAREISALYNTRLSPLKTLSLAKLKLTTDLVTVKDPDLVERFFALTLSVKVKTSPDWLKKRLNYFGVPSINNVVDITNYVMLETGEPMHAFDLNHLTGKRLIIRRAKNGERMTTLLGTPVKLTSEDLVLADLKGPQGLTMIGGQNSGTSFNTTEILLEAAVYKYANVRHTGRRLGIRTEAGTRHEKILDPNNVEIALERAVHLLAELADAKQIGVKTDYYPEKVTSTKITLAEGKIKQLSGLDIPSSESEKILVNLGCLVEKNKTGNLIVSVPTFRTDIKDPADLVEEIIRIYGYEKIPVALLDINPLSPKKFTNVSFKEKLRDLLVNLGLNETITSSIRDNDQLPTFENGGSYPPIIKIINPPDPKIASLRPSIIPGLVGVAKKAESFKQQNQAFFEIGKVFFADKKGGYHEQERLGIIKKMVGTNQLNYAKSSSIIREVLDLSGIDYLLSRTADIPSFEPDSVAEITTHDKKSIGFLGLLNSEIRQKLKLPSDFLIAELSIDALFKVGQVTSSDYFLYPAFPSLYEDLTVEVTKDSDLGNYLREISHLSPLIKDVRLTSIYERSRTIRITYQDKENSVSSEVVKPIREKIEKLGVSKYKLQIR